MLSIALYAPPAILHARIIWKLKWYLVIETQYYIEVFVINRNNTVGVNVNDEVDSPPHVGLATILSSKCSYIWVEVCIRVKIHLMI